jgi:hypothetical protein
MFFLNLRSYVMIARICLIPAAFFLFFARGAVLMAASLIILGILLAISLIRAPSDEEVMKKIKQFHEEFQKRVSAEAETKRYDQAKILTGYRNDGGFSMKRHLDGETVHSRLMDVGLARKGSDYVLYTDELNLLRRGEHDREQYTVHQLNFQYKYEPIPQQDAAVLEFMLLDTNTHFSITVQSDYHLREFLDMLRALDS